MLHEILNDKKLVLASASPRRQEIFNMLGLNPLIIPADIHEPIDERPPWLIVKSHALHKAIKVSKLFDANTVIVAADTLVYLNKTIFGKPESKLDSENYLAMLSDKTHAVYTGISILYKNKTLTDYAKSLVQFKELSNEEIQSYIKTKESFDKAGAYGIQGYGCQFIKGIKGCYFNVMGFPVHLFYTMMLRIIQE